MKKTLVVFAIAAMIAMVMSACIDGIPANPFLQFDTDNNNQSTPVNKKIVAAMPSISSHPQDAVYTTGTPAAALEVSAEVSDNGTLSYQWYSNAANINQGGTAIPNATGASYIPPTDTAGTAYYYVTVTNTLAGSTSAPVHSNTARIEVNNNVNAAYPVISHPQGAAYFLGDTATTLMVLAVVSDGGTLSYQWYCNETDSNEEGTAIDGETGTSYTPPTDTASTVYYYVIVTNTITDNGDGGNKTAAVRSNTAKIEVIEKIHAAIPVISSHPQDAVYRYNGTAAALTVSASVSDDGTLSYRWYRNDSVIPNATGTSYTPPTDTAGTVYYYVDVTNTIVNNGDGGNKTATVRSNTAAITVNQKVNASISISSQPQDAVYSYHGTAIALTVSAEADDGGTLSYQWYRNDENSNEGGTAIDGATEADYTPPTEDEGIVHYYVVITNTIADNGDGGNKTAAARSDTARIEVNEEENAAVPLILSQPSGVTYTYGDTAAETLTISAQVSDNGTLSYQWYGNAENSNTGGTAISGARGTVYTPPVGNAGMAYYYVVITNTIDDNGDGGNKSATVHSNTAAITVNRKPVTLTVYLSSKYYDRTTAANVANVTINGKIDGDNLTAVAGTATFENANAGTNKTITFSGWTLGGTAAGNYTLSQPANMTANINPRPVTLTVTVLGRNYDGTTTANVGSTTITGNLDGDNLTAVAGTATFENKNAGTNKTITCSGWSLSGSAAGNYTLQAQPSGTATITAKPVPIVIGIYSKTYDGTTTANIASAVITGKIDGDDLTIISGTARFVPDGNAGNNKQWVCEGWSLGGSAAGNYVLMRQPSGTATISRKVITLMMSVSNKEYDGNTTATANGWSLNGNIDWENLTPVAGTARFANANVGTGKTVTFSGWTLGGSAAGNYTLSAQPASTIANITAKPLTISPNAELSPIDTTATIVTGLIGSDTATINVTLPTGLTRSGNTITYNGTTAFTNPTVTLNVTASVGSNYTIPSSGTVTIKVYDGQANYTGSGNDRRIPVRQANIANFNAYARTANGLTRHYKLTENVTLTGTNNWTAIGLLSYWSEGGGFTGSFNGQGYTITGLNINATGDSIGMFGAIGSGGMVQNLGLISVNLSSEGDVGGVAAYNIGTVQNCYVSGSVSNGGGVVGRNEGTVQNCYTTANVSSISWAGGVVCYNLFGTVQNCYATGSVSGNGNVGGVVGIIYNTTSSTSPVKNCVALNPSVRSSGTDSTQVGRIIGRKLFDGGASLTNNRARSNMVVRYNTSTNKALSIGATTLDGADVSAGTGTTQYNNQTFWSSTMGWNFSTIWEWNSTTNLPVLRGFNQAQNHTVQ